jgi:MOSC domain-containing protein YiiM
MKVIKATVAAVHAGVSDQHSSEQLAAIVVELDGIVGDHHRSFTRKAFAGDKQPKGTIRRNERQWSAVSVQELDGIRTAMDIVEPLTGAAVGANICLDGVNEFSRLPQGTILRFSSGVELMVAEYNPPCLGIGTKLATAFKTNSGKPLENTAFSKAAKLTRGLVGVVEVAGTIKVGDEVEITPYEHPSWLLRSSD